MKKLKSIKNLKIKIDKEWLMGRWRLVKHWLSDLPRWLLVEHSHALDVGLSILVLVVGAWRLVRVSFFAPPNVVVPEVNHEALNVDVIDELEWWIEDVEAKRSRGIIIPQSGI
jgi:hypothetical protein